VRICNPIKKTEQREERETEQADERHFADSGFMEKSYRKERLLLK
jgi:hypothetical protein